MSARNSSGIKTRRPMLAGWSITVIAFCMAGCFGEEPVRVGFVAQLTGVQAELGVQERNGVQLAVEEINAGGGVAGRPIELVVQDDRGTPDGARAADRELIESGVVAIIGHATSDLTIAGLTVTEPAGVVMLSPTASTPELSGKVDHFFRIAQTVEKRVELFARHILEHRNIRRLATICDADNAAYGNAFQRAFVTNFQSLGGVLSGEATFSTKLKPDFAPLLAKLRAGNPSGILIIASDIDTALIAQRTRMMGWQIPLFASAWAQTETLIHNGGRAVEGMEVEIANPVDPMAPGYRDFSARYLARFGQRPSFGATLGYEAAKVLAAALQKTGGGAAGLPQALAGIRDFQVLSDTISFDEYGDVTHPVYLGAIRSGRYVDIETSKPGRF